MLSIERQGQLPEELQLSLKKHPIPHFFEEAARLHPENTALCTAEKSVTYSELKSMADSIARALLSKGVKPQDKIAVFAETSPLCVAALLGILKAGAIFVPLDPLSQKCQLSEILKQANPKLCLSEKTAVPGYLSDELNCLIISDLITNEGEEVERAIDSQDPAHIVFTTVDHSLQGIVLPHRSVTNLACWTKCRYNDYRMVAISTRPRCESFVPELISALCAGYTIKFPPGALLQSPAELKEWIYRENIEMITLPLNAAEELLEEPWSKDGPLKILFITGGRLKRPPITDLPFRVINRYGHPESGSITTEYEVSAEEESLIIPIGHPISNVNTLVLDDEFQEVPHGTSGQLCIGGMGLALEYLNEFLNHSRFVIQPRVGKRPVRLFLTGDMVKKRNDGKIEYLGNRDDQQSVGDRDVGLSAVENIIAAQPGILHVHVKPITLEEETSLTAYWIGKKNAPVSETNLKRALKRRVPPHMVPKHFIELSQFPIGVDGKICPEQLPIPHLEEEMEEERDPPTNSTEKKLLDLWDSTLHIPTPGIHTSLFEMEISPSHVAKLHEVVQQHFGKEIPLSAFYKKDTVAKQARWLINNEPTPEETCVAIEANSHESPLICLHGFVDGPFVFHRLAKALNSKVPIYAIDISDDHATIEEIAAKTAITLQQLQPSGPYRLFGEGIGAYVAYELAQQLGSKVAFVGILDTWAPSPSQKTPLFKRLQINTNHFFHLSNEEKKRFMIQKLESLESKTGELFGFNQHSDTEGELVPNQVWWTQRKKMSDYKPNPTDKELTIFICEEEGKEDPSLGWKQYSNRLKIEKLPGSRRSLCDKSQMKIFGSKLLKIFSLKYEI